WCAPVGAETMRPQPVLRLTGLGIMLAASVEEVLRQNRERRYAHRFAVHLLFGKYSRARGREHPVRLDRMRGSNIFGYAVGPRPSGSFIQQRQPGTRRSREKTAARPGEIDAPGYRRRQSAHAELTPVCLVQRRAW